MGWFDKPTTNQSNPFYNEEMGYMITPNMGNNIWTPNPNELDSRYFNSHGWRHAPPVPPRQTANVHFMYPAQVMIPVRFQFAVNVPFTGTFHQVPMYSASRHGPFPSNHGQWFTSNSGPNYSASRYYRAAPSYQNCLYDPSQSYYARSAGTFFNGYQGPSYNGAGYSFQNQPGINHNQFSYFEGWSGQHWPQSSSLNAPYFSAPGGFARPPLKKSYMTFQNGNAENFRQSTSGAYDLPRSGMRASRLTGVSFQPNASAFQMPDVIQAQAMPNANQNFMHSPPDGFSFPPNTYQSNYQYPTFSTSGIAGNFYQNAPGYSGANIARNMSTGHPSASQAHPTSTSSDGYAVIEDAVDGFMSVLQSLKSSRKGSSNERIKAIELSRSLSILFAKMQERLNQVSFEHQEQDNRDDCEQAEAGDTENYEEDFNGQLLNNPLGALNNNNAAGNYVSS